LGFAAPDIIAIPKAATTPMSDANRAAFDVKLDADALAALDEAFAPPRARRRWR